MLTATNLPDGQCRALSRVAALAPQQRDQSTTGSLRGQGSACQVVDTGTPDSDYHGCALIFI